MASDDDPTSGRAQKRKQRAQKLKSGLRANLKKRKDQMRKLSDAGNGEQEAAFSVKLRGRTITVQNGKEK